MILQLNPPLPVETPDGDGLAYFLRDMGPDFDDYWTVCLNAGPKRGQFWTYSNKVIRLGDNVTFGRIGNAE